MSGENRLISTDKHIIKDFFAKRTCCIIDSIHQLGIIIRIPWCSPYITGHWQVIEYFSRKDITWVVTAINAASVLLNFLNGLILDYIRSILSRNGKTRFSHRTLLECLQFLRVSILNSFRKLNKSTSHTQKYIS